MIQLPSPICSRAMCIFLAWAAATGCNTVLESFSSAVVMDLRELKLSGLLTVHPALYKRRFNVSCESREDSLDYTMSW
ncbi:hypothetical protein V8C34DRAFT_273973 [Trichoderma compactum]